MSCLAIPTGWQSCSRWHAGRIREASRGRHQCITPRRSSTSAALASSTAPIRPKPALFSTMSIRPKRAIASAGPGLVGDVDRDDEEVWMIVRQVPIRTKSVIRVVDHDRCELPTSAHISATSTTTPARSSSCPSVLRRTATPAAITVVALSRLRRKLFSSLLAKCLARRTSMTTQFWASLARVRTDVRRCASTRPC